MANPRELRRRIRSTQNTRKITKTMELVATSKLKRAQDRVVAARPYAAALAAVIADLYSPSLAERFALLRQPPATGAKPTALVLITSNRGLCGAFNANLIREGRRRMQELERAGGSVALHLVGKKGIGFFKFAGQAIASQRVDIGDRPTAEHAADLMAPLVAAFQAGQLDAVEVVFARFNSALSTPPSVQRILPVTPPQAAAGRAAPANYILRPSAEEILDRLLPLYVANQMFRALVETAAAEHGARRTAMKNATDNAGDMLNTLRRTYNRARQANITQEIAEIVGGAAAQGG